MSGFSANNHTDLERKKILRIIYNKDGFQLKNNYIKKNHIIRISISSSISNQYTGSI
jgi:hypothetical protein